MKAIVALVVLVPWLAAAQGVVTERVSNVAAGSETSWQVYNTADPQYAVLNGAQFVVGAPCVALPITSRPYVYPKFNDPGRVVVRNNMGTNWSYPLNINLNAFRWRICYHVNGVLPRDLILEPIMKDTANGAFYAPTNGGILIPAGTYTPGSTTNPTATATSTWSLSSFPLSTLDLANYRYEFGLRVRYAVPDGSALEAKAVKVHGLEMRAEFTRTSAPGAPIMPSVTYTPAVPPATWSSGILSVNQTMPNPSTAHSIQTYIRCSDFVFRPLELVLWGVGTSFTRNYNIQFLNSNKCTGPGTFSQGSHTRIRSVLYFNSVEVGTPVETGDIILN